MGPDQTNLKSKWSDSFGLKYILTLISNNNLHSHSYQGPIELDPDWLLLIPLGGLNTVLFGFVSCIFLSL